jgi:hypothetical protein
MRHSTFRTKAVLLGILIVSSVVGNVSLSASRVHHEATPSAVAAVSGNEIASDVASSVQVASTRVETATESSQRIADRATDQSHVVPAIFSWDPDVTFVFYRHVTKWM